ncbi:abc transporter c family member 3 [Quercus suber]|uniref:ABC-type xenobiotic transporter n=1 Tax=Quercus suber TaxID=58331 RepID=A0AAW0M1Y6_QUESU
MELTDSSNHGMSILFSNYYSSLMYSGTDFLMKPVFLRWFSGSLHLVLLFVLFISWVCNKFKVAHSEGSKERFKNSKSLCYKLAQICCLGVSVFSLVLCLLSYFYWYRNGWSDEGLVTLFDLALRTLAWGTLCVYLRTQLFNSGESKYPFLLRVWWGFFLCISCYYLIIDVVLYKKHVSLPVQNLVSDIVSVVSGLLFCYVGFFGKNEGEDTLVEEPLLNGDSSNEAESSKSKGNENVTPYLNAGFFSILTFSWMGPLITIGNKKTLDLEDVPQLCPSDSVFGVFPNFKNKLEAECGTSNGVTTLKLTKALIFSAWKEVLLTAFLVIMNTLASYVGPYFIDTFVQYLNGRRSYKNEGYVLVSVFFAAKLVECLTETHRIFRVQQVGIRVQSVLIIMIYNKGLTLSCQAKQGHTSGEIINFMTVDADRIGDFSWYMHETWMVLVQIVIALLILYRNIGLASIAALVATVFVMLANVPLGKLQEKFQDKIMESKDKRMKATSEILRNMRILKLQGWDMKFLAKIMKLRKTEAGWLKKYVYTSAMTSFVFWGAPTFVSVVTFGTCMLMGIPLESGKILSALATFSILQGPICSLPDTISMVVQTKVSLDRIASFLRLDDLQPDVIERLPRGSSDTAIEIIDGKFSWDLSSSNPTLKDINLKLQHGMRVAVCGTVGSGKSSLLSCILGEVPKISGTVKLCGTKAFVAQSPWIQSGKIEENILFGMEMEREKYETVLEACCLKKDLEILPFGDQTVIGERGINLSGGQKQRIQIARALYQDADIYLFDDPFSAVDAHTGSHLFKECLLGLLRSKTVVYVTHQVEFLPAADLILVMKDGRITQGGKYSDILNSGTDFMELVGAHEKALSALDSTEAGSVSESTSEEAGNMASTNGVVQKQEDKDVQNGKADDAVGSKGQIIQEEEREKGKVGLSVYWKYITMAYGGALVPIILLAQVLFQTLQIGSNYWMAWASPISQDVKPAVSSSTLIIVFVSLAIGSSFCILVRAMLIGTAGYKTASQLFSKMHFCIFRAPMSFFDATPSGRIISRVSGKMRLMLLGIIAVMSQVAWQVFIVFIPVIATCIWYQQYYIPSARELSRLVGVCKAPVIQHFAETLSGASTIRSFDEESRFRDKNMKLVDANSRPRFNIAGAMEWLCFRLDVLSAITFVFSLVFLVSIPEGVIDPGIAGLAVTYGLNLNMLLAWVIWSLCQMENKIISVERIFQYSSIPSEPPLVIEERRADHFWPSHGEVDIRDLQVRYAPHMPLVLRGLTCTFPGGLKTGIALDKCQLGDEVRKKEGKLDSTVSENGENWSVGQRQLVCLGRVLLKKSKVLVLDEATASVDTATDNLIQQTLRQHFYNCTVITIAHRITSVLDSDMVLLLSNEYTVRANSSFGK